MEFEAYSLKAKAKVGISNPQLVKFRNGSFAVQGDAASGPPCRVNKIIGKAEAESLMAGGWTVEERA